MTKKICLPSSSILLPASLFFTLSSLLPGLLSRWQELSSERSLRQETAVTPHQTSSKPRGPWWRHSWVDGHDHSLLTDRINHPPSPPTIVAVLLLISVPWPLSVVPLQLVSCTCRCCSAHVHVTVVLSPDKAEFSGSLLTKQAFSVQKAFLYENRTVR